MKIHTLLYKFIDNCQFIMFIITEYNAEGWKDDSVFKNLLLLHRMHIQSPALSGGSQPSLTSVPRNSYPPSDYYMYQTHGDKHTQK